jgi:hypothetical protein
MVEAYFFFYSQFESFFIGTKDEPPLASNIPLSKRLDECWLALLNVLKVVEIDLQQGDDAQVIFETLNARGEPLLPADLLRNYIFLRAARRGEPQEELYKQYWASFDEQFWRDEITQGRLKRPRSDLFLQHFLASRLTADVPVKHLFVEYKFWIEREKPFSSVKEELICLARQGKDFRRIVAPIESDVFYDFAMFLDAFDISTCYPLLLMLLDFGLNDDQWDAVTRILESYLLRRAMCGLTTKGYNRIFLSLTRTLRRDGATPERLARLLKEQTGDSMEWPADDRFGGAWRFDHVYQVLNNRKIVYILKRLNETYITGKMETLSVHGGLTIEHIMPQEWQPNWPLPDGSKGLSWEELRNVAADNSRGEATLKRNTALHTIGNLTILTQKLNSSISNSDWKTKKKELLKHSLLPINQQLHEVEIWDEQTIARRSEDLLVRALKLWSHP